MKAKSLINSFKYAFTGIKSALKRERNVKIHFTIMFLVIILGIILKINRLEWIICISWFAMVIGAELFNTALEISIDLFMPEENKYVKQAKDISAGAVLTFAIGSAIVGLIIFIPKIIYFIKL